MQVKLSEELCIEFSDAMKGQDSGWELTILMTYAIYVQSKAEAAVQATELMAWCSWGESVCLCLCPWDFLDSELQMKGSHLGPIALELVPLLLATVVPFSFLRKVLLLMKR